jgi:hypothetical protein
MQTTQLRHLAARAEGRLAQDTPVDIAAGVAGAAIMTLAWLTPFLSPLRNHWGLTAEEASSPRPGDDCVPQPRWSWTHALDVDASAEEIWPWLAQLGADRAGFYSYQWLENLAKCNVRNAETIHPEWAHKVGDDLLLHPTMPPLRVVTVEPGRSLVAVLPLLADPTLPQPDYIIADVGATLVHGDSLQPIQQLQGVVDARWPGETQVASAIEPLGRERQDVPQARRCSYFCTPEQAANPALREIADELDVLNTGHVEKGARLAREGEAGNHRGAGMSGFSLRAIPHSKVDHLALTLLNSSK